jgi:hypothetical protein
MDGLIFTQITEAGYYKAVDFGKQTFLAGEIWFLLIIILPYLKSLSHVS